MSVAYSSPALTHGPAATTTGEWHRYWRFVRRPALPPSGVGAQPGGLKALGRLYLLDLVIMAVLVACAMAAYVAGIEFPENALEGLTFTPVIIALVVLVAPLYEEIFFRFWLSGRPGHVLAVLLLVLSVGAILAAPDGPVLAVAIMAAALVGAAVALFAFRNRPPMRWFRRGFPLLFYLASVGFALIHFVNYDETVPLVALLPLVLPQFIAGTLFGYMRVRYGFWTAVALHALHNGTALSLALAGEALAS